MKADVFPATAVPAGHSILGAGCHRAMRQGQVTGFDRNYEAACRKSNYFEHEPECDGSCLMVSRRIYFATTCFVSDIADLVRDHLADITDAICHLYVIAEWKRVAGTLPAVIRRIPAPGARHRSQDAAMLELFNTALACRKAWTATTTRREIEQQRDRYLAKADELEDDAWMMLVQRRSTARSVFKSWPMQPKSTKTTPASSTRPARRWRLSASMTAGALGRPDHRQQIPRVVRQADVWPDRHDHVGRPGPRDQVRHGP